MNIYKPEPRPLAPPIIWGERYYQVPPSESQWRDSEIRRGMEYALNSEETRVVEITKELISRDIEPLIFVSVEFPYQMPPSVYKPGCMSEGQELQNSQLQSFADTAYSRLESFFITSNWENWFVAPYFSAEDDMHEVLNVGLFILNQDYKGEGDE